MAASQGRNDGAPGGAHLRWYRPVRPPPAHPGPADQRRCRWSATVVVVVVVATVVGGGARGPGALRSWWSSAHPGGTCPPACRRSPRRGAAPGGHHGCCRHHPPQRQPVAPRNPSVRKRCSLPSRGESDDFQPWVSVALVTKHPFLSDAWFDEVRRLHDAVGGAAPEGAEIRMNLMITSTPVRRRPGHAHGRGRRAGRLGEGPSRRRRRHAHPGLRHRPGDLRRRQPRRPPSRRSWPAGSSSRATSPS